MEPLFEGLTSSEIDYLKYVHKCKYFDGFEMFLNIDSSSDYRIRKLVNNGYIVMSENPNHPNRYEVVTTDKGLAALIDYDKFQNKTQKHSKIEWKKYYLGILISILSILIAILIEVL